jgi:Circularly permutated YpsA SLOG family
VPGEHRDVRTARPDGEHPAFLYIEPLRGGTRLTRNLCALLQRPYVLINAAEMPDPIAASAAIAKFNEQDEIEVLNVAGPRLSGWAASHAFALSVIGEVIQGITAGALSAKSQRIGTRWTRE